MKDVAELRALVAEVTDRMAADPDGDVIWVGDVEGRRGVRMRQQARDVTVVWFEAGQRTLGVEALVLPAPPRRREEVYRQCLRRNARTRVMRFAIDGAGDLVLVGRVPAETVDRQEIELLLGEIHEMVEVSFGALVRAGYGRENPV